MIFRRGPSQHAQMLLWDLDTDTVTSGQWIKAKILTPYAQVSDDARYVAFLASDYRYRKKSHRLSWPRHVRNHTRWVAVSRPPYFTAIGLWSAVDIFRCRINLRRKIKLPPEAKSIAKMALHSGRSTILKSRNWVGDEVPVDNRNWLHKRLSPRPSRDLTYTKQFRNGYLKLYESFDESTLEVHDLQGECHIKLCGEQGHPIWADIDRNGRLVYADKGCLWAWANFPAGEPQLIADLNKNTFEEVPPPQWALEA